MTSPESKMAERGANVSHCTGFFPSLLSTVLVFFFTETSFSSFEGFFSVETVKKIARLSKVR